MNMSPGSRFAWRNITFRSKLIIVFALQLLLIAVIGVTAFFSLRASARQRDVLRTAQQLEGLAFNLELEFVEAREIQGRMLQGWDDVGYSNSVTVSVPAFVDEIDQIRETTGEIEALLEGSPLAGSEQALVDVRTLIGIAGIYEEDFLSAVDTLGELADEEDGALVVLARRLNTLQQMGQAVSGDDILVGASIDAIHNQEMMFLNSGNDAMLVPIVEEASLLDERLAGVGSDSAIETQLALAAYLEQLNVVSLTLDEFEGQSLSLDSVIGEAELIWSDLAALGSAEADSALANANQIDRVANTVLGLSIAIAVGVGSIITYILWRGVNVSLSSLISVADELERGNLQARVPVDSRDEFGQLGTTLNAMVGQLEDTIGGLETQARERIRDLEAIGIIGHATTQLQSPAELLDEVVNLIRERFGYYHAQVFLIDETGERAVLKASTGEAGRALMERQHSIKVGTQSVIGTVTAQGNPVVAHDTDTDVVHRRNELLPNTRSEMALPMRAGFQIVGALDVQSVEPDAFNEGIVAAFQTVADQLAVSVSNATLFDEAQAAMVEVESLERQLTGQAWSKFVSRRELATRRTFRIDDGVVIADGYGVQLDLPGEMLHDAIVVHEGKQNGDVLIAVPIKVRGEIVGAFEFGGEGVVTPSRNDLALVEAVTERLGQVLENMRLFEQTQHLAQREQIVNQITSRIVGSTDVSDILQTTIQELGRVLHSSKTSIQLFGEQDDE